MTNQDPSQTPRECPACNAPIVAEDLCYGGHLIEYTCGAMFNSRIQEWGGRCSSAFSAAVSLRAERDDLQAMYQRAWTEIGELRAERDAALAQVKMFSDNEGGALTFHILRTWDREKLERFCLHLLGDDWQTLTARAEKAEGEREDFLAERKRREELLHGMNRVGAQREAYWSMRVIELEHDLTDADADLTAARARLAELQAVCDAAIKWRANVERHSNPNWISVADLIQAVDEYSAALASGAVVEGETK